MRIAIVTESFLPVVNGVTNSVLRVLEHLARTGHQALVIAPDYAGTGPASYAGHPVTRVRSTAPPGAGGFRVALPTPRIESVLREFRPDVVHLASPFLLGSAAGRAAKRLRIPSVAIFQTNVAGFAGSYGAPQLAQAAIWRWLRRIHEHTAVTLAPSPTTVRELLGRGFHDVHLWPRGVDAQRFNPQHRDLAWRRSLGIADTDLAVGYVGRLAPEKRVEGLACLSNQPGVKTVVVGDGPDAASLRRVLPDTVFTGHLDGAGLSRAHASLDVFVHLGPDETFCQAAQEALASGVPVVAVNSGGVADLVTNGHTGFLLPAQDPEQALRPVIGRYLNQPGLRERHGLAARESVAHRTWEGLGDILLGHYSQVTAAAQNQPLSRAS